MLAASYDAVTMLFHDLRSSCSVYRLLAHGMLTVTVLRWYKRLHASMLLVMPNAENLH